MDYSFLKDTIIISRSDKTKWSILEVKLIYDHDTQGNLLPFTAFRIINLKNSLITRLYSADFHRLFYFEDPAVQILYGQES